MPPHPTPGSPQPPLSATQEYAGVVLQRGARPLPEYELICPLGRGGVGEVWKAVGPGGVEAALKFIPLGGDAGRLETQSLELMKNIRHPHLLALFGAWRRGDFLILAMELADRTLMQRWQESADKGLPGIPRDELLEYMREAAKGLDFLNEARHPTPDGTLAGVQHKDVKPHNLLLVGGAVKVADFGLAKVLEHTAMGVSGGLTPAYAAPEFFAGLATRWSDQYSLAATYCQLRGGRTPFRGSLAELTAGHLSRPPDLSMLPEAERPAVARALSKKPESRWPNCRAFVEALAAAAAPPKAREADAAAVPTMATTRTVAPRRKPRRWMVGLIVAIIIPLLACAGVLGLAAWNGFGARPSTRPLSAPPGQPPPVPPPPAVRLPPVADPAISIVSVGYQTLERGGKRTINFPINRKERREPMELRLTDLPAGVTADPVTVEEDSNDAKVTVTAGPGAAVTAGIVRLEASCDGAHSEMDFGLAVVDRAEQERAAKRITDLGGRPFVNDMHPGRPVNGVQFFHASLKDDDLACLDGLTALNSLLIVNAAISDEGLTHLRGLLNLSDLDLIDDRKITDAGLANLRGLTALHSLNLSGDRIGDAGLAHLEGLTAMAVLNLDSTRVTSAGLKRLHAMKAMSMLLLHGTKVSDAGLEDLKGFPQMFSLDLMDTQVTADGVKELKRALPNAHISPDPK